MKKGCKCGICRIIVILIPRLGLSWDYGGTMPGNEHFFAGFFSPKKVGEKLKKIISRKIYFSDKLVSKIRAGSMLIIVPRFGAKRLDFRAKQIVPKIGTRFWQNCGFIVQKQALRGVYSA